MPNLKSILVTAVIAIVATAVVWRVAAARKAVYGA